MKSKSCLLQLAILALAIVTAPLWGFGLLLAAVVGIPLWAFYEVIKG